MDVFTVGRFQPYNRSHKDVFEKMSEFGESAVGMLVGPTSYDNPFRYDERREMVGKDVGEVFPLELTLNLFDFRKQVMSRVGESRFYTRDKDSKILFEAFGFPVSYESRDGISSSDVRESLFSEEPDWQDMVDEKTVEVINRPDVQTRLESLEKGRTPISKVRKYISLV